MNRLDNKQRIVITGMGVISPNGIGVSNFLEGIKNGRSGIRHIKQLEDLKFRCQVAGVPIISDDTLNRFKEENNLHHIRSSGILYGCMAAKEAWQDAELPQAHDEPHWRSGCIFGTGSNGVEATYYGVTLTDQGRIRDSDPETAEQAMNGGVSAYIGGLLGLGNKVTSNASACNTGTEAILAAYDRIRFGLADIMLVGSSESCSPYVWGPFDSMFATAQGYNHLPEEASKPLSKYATGFVPSSGAGALIVESLTSAKQRKAKIYAEVLGGNINSGGHRGDGTMTIGNISGMVRCIEKSIQFSGIQAQDIDLISGHLSSTIGDIKEIVSWTKALNRSNKKFPLINSMKSMIGHCLSASGSIESIAAILQLHHGFVHASLNSSELHPEIASLIDISRVPQKTIFDAPLDIAAKISLGFGDVNSCILLKKWTN